MAKGSNLPSGLIPCSAHSCFQNSMPTERTKEKQRYWSIPHDLSVPITIACERMCISYWRDHLWSRYWLWIFYEPSPFRRPDKSISPIFRHLLRQLLFFTWTDNRDVFQWVSIKMPSSECPPPGNKVCTDREKITLSSSASVCFTEESCMALGLSCCTYFGCHIVPIVM